MLYLKKGKIFIKNIKKSDCIILSILGLLIICLIVTTTMGIIKSKNNKKEYQTSTTTVQETTEEPINKKEKTTKETIVDTTETTVTKINKIETTQVAKVEKTTITEPTQTEPAETMNKPEYTSLGTFKLTAYCACSKCCGQWAGSPTASGVMPKANHTIAVDTSVISFGTEVMIDGFGTYVAEDTGSAIIGNKIDIFFSDHQTAWDFGVQYAEVFIVNN